MTPKEALNKLKFIKYNDKFFVIRQYIDNQWVQIYPDPEALEKIEGVINNMENLTKQILDKFELEQNKYKKAREEYIRARVRRDDALAALKPYAELDENIQYILWQHGIGLPQED